MVAIYNNNNSNINISQSFYFFFWKAESLTRRVREKPCPLPDNLASMGQGHCIKMVNIDVTRVCLTRNTHIKNDTDRQMEKPTDWQTGRWSQTDRQRHTNGHTVRKYDQIILFRGRQKEVNESIHMCRRKKFKPN